MSVRRSIQPPAWAQRLLRWYCRPELLEDLQGDLNEYFERNLNAKGAGTARLIYVLDVLKFMRTYTLRKPAYFNPLIHWIMIRSYIKTSGRNLVRNKLFTTINVIGLSISMSVGLLLISMISDLYSYDTFHEHSSRIYRVTTHYRYLDNKETEPYATSSLRAAKVIDESVTGIDDVAIFQREFSADVRFHEKEIPFSGFYANPSVLKVFSFPLLEGDRETALRDPFSVVLTETSAKKLFGDESAVGATVMVNGDREYTITGIVEDLPAFSHLQFEVLCSLSTREVTGEGKDRALAWDNIWNTWTYLLLPSETDPAAIEQQFDDLSEQENRTVEHAHISLSLQPITDIITGDNLSNQIGSTMGETPVKIFSGLVIIVILSACFNYTNLSIARSFKRAREVGIRKAIGALRSQVIHQFVVESIVISLISLVFALGIFLLVRPHFISIEDSLQSLLRLHLTPLLILMFTGFAIAVGFLAGLLPSLFFARLNTIHVLKRMVAVPAFRNVPWRKALIVFQYCISIIGISATIILYQQYKHFLSYDLGFTTENVLNIKLQGAGADALKKRLMELPEVTEISQSDMITSTGDYWGTNMINPHNPQDSAMVYHNRIDPNYLPLHEHTLLAGRNFFPTSGQKEEFEVIVNEAVLKRFDIADQDVHKAIGEVVRIDRKDVQIVGVIKDFSYGQVNNRTPQEVVLRTSNGEYNYLNVKVSSTDWDATLDKIESIWKDIDPVHPFQGKFYVDQIEEAYRGMKASVKVGGFLAMLVICIASLGLLGMVVFTTETRLREVSIRKVFGASEYGLLYLLSRNFLLLLVLAGAISLPATYLFFEHVILPEINNHAPVGITHMVGGMLAVIGIALMMIASQTLKISRANPADVLKSE